MADLKTTPNETRKFDCTIKRMVEYKELHFTDVLTLLTTGMLNMKVGDIITIPLKNGMSDDFVLTQEDEEAYRFESATCIGNKAMAYAEIPIMLECYQKMLPDILVDNIVRTKRKYHDRQGTIRKYGSLLFLPAASEVFSEDYAYGDTGLYEQIEWYKDRRHRMRKLTQDSKDTTAWWLISAYAGTADSICGVNSTGNAYSYYEFCTWIGTPVCFRIRKSK